jgi:hypothetical protein
MVFITKSGPSLCISPWKDGLKNFKTAVSDCKDDIENVLVVFQGNSGEDILDEDDLIALFTVIGNDLSKLNSLTITLESSGSLSSTSVESREHKRLIPPLGSINAILNGNNKLQCLNLVELRLMGNDNEIKGFFARIQEHPTLSDIIIKDCIFARNSHFKEFQRSLESRPKRNTILDGSIILESNVLSKSDKTNLLQSFPLLCCF